MVTTGRKLPELKRGAPEACLENLLPLDGGGLSLPAIASRSGEAGGVGVKSPEVSPSPLSPPIKGGEL
jgi:hypothetical protein